MISRNCLPSEMNGILASLLFFSVYLIVTHGSGQDIGNCCRKKTVSGTEDGLDGEFILVRSQGPEPLDALCVDSCVYKR